MQTLPTTDRPVLTFEQADQLTDLIYAAVDATRAYEQVRAENPATTEAIHEWCARLAAAGQVDREATHAAVKAVRDLARSPR